jgi:CRISPR-associated protein Csm2
MSDTPQERDDARDKDKRGRRRRGRGDRPPDAGREKAPDSGASASGERERNRDRDRDRGGSKEKPRESEKIIQRIENLDDLSSYAARDLVRDARRLAKIIGNLKTAQVRKIYGSVKEMQMDFRRQAFDLDRLILLQPRLAYAANKNYEARPLQQVFDACIGKIRDGEAGKQDFERFVHFFEAILAYHSEHRRN